MNSQPIIAKTIAFVKETLKDAEGGHDWFHTHRVFLNARLLAQSADVDMLVVELAALLHDIADSKFHGGDESLGPRIAKKFLEENGVQKEIVQHVIAIIQYLSFKNSLEKKGEFGSKEFDIVQDADRLDAIGAIGIARAFNYGGYKNRELYNPAVAPNLNMTKTEYKNSTAPTINHFYEKLLLLKDQMNTEAGRKMAAQRHQFMMDYLEQFYAECEGLR